MQSQASAVTEEVLSQVKTLDQRLVAAEARAKADLEARTLLEKAITMWAINM